MLREKGYSVRVLTREASYDDEGIEVYKGGLNDWDVLRSFLDQADMVFHCAGEMNDSSKMWEVNVHGTMRLLSQLNQSGAKYFCHISSAGVIGKTSQKWVDEKTPCRPQNTYERSKWAAEQVVAQGIQDGRVVILRPTNVVDDHQPGVIEMPMRSRWKDWIRVFIKGAENAHIVHADDVAQAALYGSSLPIDKPECFFVSCDNEKMNTFGGVWSLYKAIRRGKAVQDVKSPPHVPLIVPYILRKILRGSGNFGDVRYSSQKLLSTGFRFSLGVEGAVRRIISARQNTPT